MVRRGEGSIRSRAASIITSPLATIHQGLLHDLGGRQSPPGTAAFDEKDVGLDGSDTHGIPQSGVFGKASADLENPDRFVRTLPPWVFAAHGHQQPGKVPGAPDGAVVAQHNSDPASGRPGQELDQGALDHWSPPWPGATPDDTYSRWRGFVSACTYPRTDQEHSLIVTEDWLRENGPDYSRPWLAQADGNDLEEQTGFLPTRPPQRTMLGKFQRKLFRSPVVPLIFRLIVMGFSIVALGLACSIFHITKLGNNEVPQIVSTHLAIIVDTIAIVYLVYISYDEYSGQPLGLRATRAKLRLIFLDLIFIVFDSANLAIAFTDLRNGNCPASAGPTCTPAEHALYRDLLVRQRALAAVLLVALVAWLFTFAISIARLVEKITH